MVSFFCKIIWRGCAFPNTGLVLSLAFFFISKALYQALEQRMPQPWELQRLVAMRWQKAEMVLKRVLGWLLHDIKSLP